MTAEEQNLLNQIAAVRAQLADAEQREREGDLIERARAMADVMRLRTQLAALERRLATLPQTGTVNIPPPLPDLPVPGGGPIQLPPMMPAPYVPSGPTPTMDPWGPPALDGRVPAEVLMSTIAQMQQTVDMLPVVQTPSMNPPATIPRAITGVLMTVGSYLLDRGQGQLLNWFLRWLHEDAEPEFDNIARETSGYTDSDCSLLYKKMNKAQQAALDAWWGRRTCPMAAAMLTGTERDYFMMLVVGGGPPPAGCGCSTVPQVQLNQRVGQDPRRH